MNKTELAYDCAEKMLYTLHEMIKELGEVMAKTIVIDKGVDVIDIEEVDKSQ